MNDDDALLRSYAEEGSESAFTALVGRHVDFVYATALRRVGDDSHLAADIAQAVFTTLARQARTRWRPAALGAWLHTATRNAALNAVIAEQRRRAREQVTLDPAFAPGGNGPDWNELRPVLDAAIDELAEADRIAVVLRCLQQRPFAEIGDALKISADGARMRTERALDKLRAGLARRGITSTAAAVGAIISAQPAISAPAGLAASVAAGAFAAASTGLGAGALTVVFASLMKLKTIVTGAAILLAFGVGAYVGLMQQFDAPPLPAPETPRHSQMIADLRKENLALRSEAAALKAANAKLAAPTPPPMAPRPAVAAPATASLDPVIQAVRVSSQQKAMLSNLRMVSAALKYFEQVNKRPPSSIHELVGADKYIKQLVPVDGEDYSRLTLVPGQLLTLTTANGLTVTLDPVGNQTTQPTPAPPPPPELVELQQRLREPIQNAMRSYQAAHNGSQPPPTEAGLKALLPYFTTPQEGADFVEFLEVSRKAGVLPH